MSFTSRAATAVLTVGLAAGLAACGSSSSDSDDAAASTTTTSSAAEQTTTSAASSSDMSSRCSQIMAQAKSLTAASVDVGQTAVTGGDTSAAVAAAKTELSKLGDLLPSDLSDDVATISGGLDAFDARAKSLPAGNSQAVVSVVNETLNTPQVQSAQTAVDSWVTTNCPS